MIRGVRFNAYFTPSWATLARQCTTEAGSQQFGDNISAACVLRTVEAPWQTFFEIESNEPNVSVSLARVFVGDEFQKHRDSQVVPSARRKRNPCVGVRATSEAPERIMKDERSDWLGETTRATSD